MRQLGLAAMGLGLALAMGGALAEDRSAQAGPPHAGHAAAAPADTPATRGFKAAHGQMMRAMAVPYTGDPDVDFRLQMIPHHQGAIAMAQVALDHARDPWTRQLAEAIIVEQQREIAEMRAWLVGHGVAAASGDEATHILRADSYRS